MDLTQGNLPPAVSSILTAIILGQAQTLDQVKKAAHWFVKVGEEGFRFGQANLFTEFMRRAIELRRSSADS